MRSKRTLMALVASLAGAALVAGCGGGAAGGQSGQAASGSSAATQGGVALTIGKPDGTQTNNSNPFVATSSGRVMGYVQVIYEPLADFNAVKPQEDFKPRLAESWEFSEDYTEVKINVRQGVKWTDGEDLTADDVAYSFQIRKDNEALNSDALPIGDIAVDGNTVTIKFTRPVFVNAQKVLGTFIVPEHIWKDIADPVTDLNQNPVGTGPFVFESWSNQAVILKANPEYWNGMPKVPELRYTSYNDNSALTTALIKGDAQWGWTFIADYENVYVAPDPDHNKAWFPTNLSVDALFLNTTKAPFDNPALRKAVAMVIDRDAISTQASSGVFPATKSVTGLPSPAGDEFQTTNYKGKEYTPDIDGAKKVLMDAGYTYSGDKLMDPSGNPVTFTLADPAGWADYLTALQIISENVKEIGIDATVDAPNVDTWNTNVATGQFDAILHWTDSGSTPWNIYSNIMDGLQLKPLGETAAWNFGRYDSQEATDALAEYATASSDDARTAALEKIQQIFVDEVPAIVTTARPALAEYSTKYYTGWPDEDNPYMSPDPTQPGAALILMSLEPVK